MIKLAVGKCFKLFADLIRFPDDSNFIGLGFEMAIDMVDPQINHLEGGSQELFAKPVYPGFNEINLAGPTSLAPPTMPLQQIPAASLPTRVPPATLAPPCSEKPRKNEASSSQSTSMEGAANEASIAALGRDDLLAYQRAWVRPEGATLLVVGDTTLKEIVPLLEKHFGDWKGEGAAPANRAIPAVALPKKPRVFLIDQPGAIQANLYVGQLVPSTTDAGAVKFDIANSVLGGEFSSRLNMNLREDKHWAYGSYSFTSNALGQRPWIAFAPVQIDKTIESLKELQREIADFAAGKAPPTAQEVGRIQSTEIRSLPGSYETANVVTGTPSWRSRTDFCAPRPKASIATTEATPIKMPRTDRAVLTLLLAKVRSPCLR